MTDGRPGFGAAGTARRLATGSGPVTGPDPGPVTGPDMGRLAGALCGSGRETEAERDVRQRLQRALGTRVELKHKGGRGTLEVHFASFAELESLMNRFGA